MGGGETLEQFRSGEEQPERGCKQKLLRSYGSLFYSLSAARFGMIVGIEHPPSLVTIEMFSWGISCCSISLSLSGSAGHVATREKRRERVIERWVLFYIAPAPWTILSSFIQRSLNLVLTMLPSFCGRSFTSGWVFWCKSFRFLS